MKVLTPYLLLLTIGFLLCAVVGCEKENDSPPPAEQPLTLINYLKSNSELTDNAVNVLRFQENEALWIGTVGSGLIQVKNDDWVSFNQSNSDLPGNTILDILIQENGRIWVMTQFHGIAFLENGNWTVFSVSEYPWGKTRESVMTGSWLEQNTSGDVFFWSDSGLRKYDDSNGWQLITAERGRGIAINSKNEIYTGDDQNHELYKLAPASNEKERVFEINGGITYGLEAGVNDEIWAVAAGHETEAIAEWNGTLKYHGKSGNSTLFDLKSEYMSSTVIGIDPFTGNVWSDVAFELIWYDGNDWHIVDSWTYNKAIKSFAFDKNGNAWIALGNTGFGDNVTFSGGIVVYNEQGINLDGLPITVIP